MVESLSRVQDPAPETNNMVVSLKRIGAQVAEEVSSHRPQRMGKVSQQEPVARLFDSQTGSTEEDGEQDVWCP